MNCNLEMHLSKIAQVKRYKQWPFTANPVIRVAACHFIGFSVAIREYADKTVAGGLASKIDM